MICYYLGLAILTTVICLLIMQVYTHFKQTHNRHKVTLLEAERLVQQVSNIVAQSHQKKPSDCAWQGWRKFRIERIVKENSTIKSFYLTAHDGKALAPFLPGQYLTFRLKVPGHSRPITRCYSLSNGVDEQGYYRVSIREQLALEEGAPDGVSSCYFHSCLEEGDILDVRAPSGKFYLDLTEKTPAVMIGGGIGLTPALSKIDTLYHRSTQRDSWLLYGVKTVEDLIMSDHLDEIEDSADNFHIHRFFSDEAASGKNAHDGRITVEAMKALDVPMDADFYICGPSGMIDSLVHDLKANGVSDERIHFESFGPGSLSKNNTAKSDNTGAQENAADALAVNFSLSNKNIKWSKSQGTLLDAAESAGVVIDSGCRAGNCGACLTTILEGSVEYTDEPGMDVKKNQCLPCISIPKQALKLSL